VFIIIVVYFLIDSVQKLLDTPSYVTTGDSTKFRFRILILYYGFCSSGHGI